MRLKDKVALITGGAKGMGAADARLFAREGASVAAADILVDEGERVASEIAESGGNAAFVHLDVTSEENWARAVETVVDRFGGLDILVNNAGIFELATVEDTTVEGWERVLDINTKGVFLGTKAVIPAMRQGGGGSIVNISSVAGLIGSPRSAAYNTSKGAVRLLTKATAVQHAADGIWANSVHPGLVDTDMLSEVFPERDDFFTQRVSGIPLGRLATADDVAQRRSLPGLGRVVVHDRERAGD